MNHKKKNKHTEKIRGKSIIDNDDIGVLSSTQTSSRNFIASKSNQFNIRNERFISRVRNKFHTTTTIKCDSISSCEAVQSVISVLYFYHQHKLKLQTLNAAKSNIPKIGDEIEINTAEENTATLDAKYGRFIERYSHEPSIDQFKRFAKIKYVDAKKYITSRKQDKKTHIHRGIVCGFKKRNCQIDIKQNDGKIYSYVLDEIQYKILKQDNDQFDELNLMGRSAVRHMSSELVQYLHSVDEWINHYEHVLYTHMKNDKQIELIHNEFIQKYNIHCELKKCSFYDRFNHKKYINDKNENEIYEQLFDAFHCYLFHSSQIDRDNVKKDKLNEFKDLFLKKYEELYEMNLVQTEQKDGNENLVLTEYSLGHRFYYWEYYTDNEWYVKQKYNTIKNEILNNKVSTLTAKVWSDNIERAITLWTVLKHTIKSADTNYWLHYLIDEGVEIDLEHIIVVLLYTNFDKLSYQFSSTFRKVSSNETNFELKERNREFWNFSKLLRETVECWGTSVQATKFCRFYHGVNVAMVVNSYTAAIHGPTSTTLNLQIAFHFTQGNGIIYELEKYRHYNLRFFDCRRCSMFADEQEMLFFGGQYPLQISGIRHIESGENYQAFALNANIFENFITGKYDSAMSVDIVLLKQLITSQLSLVSDNRRQGIRLKNYLDKCFYQYCEKRKGIKINVYHLKNYYNEFQDLFLSNKCNNLLSIDFICKLFTNCETIMSYKTGNISSEYLSLLHSMLKKRLLKLQKIEIYCKRLISLADFKQYQSLFMTIAWNLQKSNELPLIVTVQKMQ